MKLDKLSSEKKRESSRAALLGWRQTWHPARCGADTSSSGRRRRKEGRKRHVRTARREINREKAGERREMFASVVTQLPPSGRELPRREPDFLNYLPLSVNRNTHL